MVVRVRPKEGVIESVRQKKLLLSLGKDANQNPKTTEQLELEVGLTKDRVLNALSSLQQKSALRYKILPDGRVSLQYLNSSLLKEIKTITKGEDKKMYYPCGQLGVCPYGGDCWVSTKEGLFDTCLYDTEPWIFREN